MPIRTPDCLRVALAALLLAGVTASEAQYALDPPPPLAEGEIALPAQAPSGKLMPIEMPPRLGLRYGLAPESLEVTPEGVIRYVVVASNEQTRNVSFEGIRCATGEFRVYARHDGTQWRRTGNTDWRPIERAPYLYLPVLVRQGFCEGKMPPRNTRELLDRMRRFGTINPDSF